MEKRYLNRAMSPILVVSRQGEFKLQRTEKGFQQSDLIIVSRILFFLFSSFKSDQNQLRFALNFQPSYVKNL